MKRIAVIGTGYVGLVTGACFAEKGNIVTCCDIDQSKIEMILRFEMPIYESGLEQLVRSNTASARLSFTADVAGTIRAADIIFVAVGTPMSVSGAADLRYVKAVAKTIGENLHGYKIVVNKSTVPVGTARMMERLIRSHLADRDATFNVVSNPEFLREGSAVHDCMNMERAVIGADDERAAKAIAELYEPFHTKILITDQESAEMIKYAANTFLATKISFINAIANICERLGADVTKVAEGIGMDSRIGSRFLRAGVGYGGSCFPKDTHALVNMADMVGYDFELLKAVIATNEKQRMSVVRKAEYTLGNLRGRTVAVLGLAFKPNTNDLREAPSIPIIHALLQKGAIVQAYDPVANKEAEIHFGEQIRYCGSAYDAVRGSDCSIIVTDWDELLRLDLQRVRSLMKTPVIIDGRNCFNPHEMRELGFIYQSIGRPVL